MIWQNMKLDVVNKQNINQFSLAIHMSSNFYWYWEGFAEQPYKRNYKARKPQSNNLTVFYFSFSVQHVCLYIQEKGHFLRELGVINSRRMHMCPSVLLCFGCINIGNFSQNAYFKNASMFSLVSWSRLDIWRVQDVTWNSWFNHLNFFVHTATNCPLLLPLENIPF
jgi:hypothetical protein